MKKASRAQKPTVSKTTFQIAKTASVASVESSPMRDSAPAVSSSHPFEDNLMGDTRGGSSKSEAMDKNLNQMFDVLRLRLNTLDEVTKTRKYLSSQDPLENSNQKSDPTSKIVDEFDNEAIPRSLKDTRLPTMVQKDNLVSSDTVYIDSAHLVFSKLRAPTEAAKKLEVTIEESLGNVNLREMKSKKSKSLNQTEKSKKSEQLKNEAKRITRLKLEKQLQAVMDDDKTVVTRSVMDPDQILNAPESLHLPMEFPIHVKWPTRDPRSQDEANIEGQFDPDLLLRYAIERMTIPSGKKLFAWLVRQAVVHNYFIHAFWITKTKFFDANVKEDVEAYLLRQLSEEYKSIIVLLASRTNAEHEKDFVFKYFPFILTNGIYYAFFYLHPGSRHLYTRGFKKSIYMQIVQIMYGLQLCVSSVKVSWQKVFPDDAHDDAAGAAVDAVGEGAEDVGESFPIPMAVKGPKGSWVRVQTSDSGDESEILDASTPMHPLINSPTNNDGIRITVTSEDSFNCDVPVQRFPGALATDDDGLLSQASSHTSFTGIHNLAAAHLQRQSSSALKKPAVETVASAPDPAHDATAGFTRPQVCKGRLKGGFISDLSLDQIPQSVMASSKSESALGVHNFSNKKRIYGGVASPQNMHNEIDANNKLSAKALASLVGIAGISRPSNTRPAQYNSQNPDNESPSTNAGGIDSGLNLSPVGRGVGSPGMTRFKSRAALTLRTAASKALLSTTFQISSAQQTTAATTDIDFDAGKSATLQFAEEPKVQSCLSRTYLKPPIDKPSNPRLISKRQIHHERLGALQKSPQMQLHLSNINGNAAAKEETHAQSFQRTMPISWCPAGGTDTHKKQVINIELHNDISLKLRKSVADQYQQAIDHHKNKIQTREEITKSMRKVLSSGQTNISRFSLDLIRRQRAMRGGNAAPGHGVTSGGGVSTSVPGTAGGMMKETLGQAVLASTGGGGGDGIGLGLGDSSELDMSDIQRLADYDDDELEEWLRDF